MLKWTADSSAKAQRLLRSLILDDGTRWGDAPASGEYACNLQPWQEQAFAAVLGLPGDWDYGDRDMIEVCGPVGCGKDQLIAAAALAIMRCAPPGTTAWKQSTKRDKSAEVVRAIRAFIARDRDWAEETGGMPTVGWGIHLVRDEVRSVCPLCERETCSGGGDCPKSGPGSRRCRVNCESLEGHAAAGARVHATLCNEVQEWPGPQGLEVYDHLFARYDKLSGARFACFTNAPFTAIGDWRRDRHTEARREGSDWYYLQVAVEDCPWITAKKLAKKRRNMTPQKFRRWYYCEPSDGRGELVTKDEVRRCTFETLALQSAPTEPGLRFLGVDIGVTRDHTALVLLRVWRQVVYLERVDVWIPRDGKEVPLHEVEGSVLDYGRRWKAQIWYDPSQAKQMMQTVERAGLKPVAVPYTAVNMTEMCSAIRELFRDGRVRFFPDAGRTEIKPGTVTSLGQQLADAEVIEQERGDRIKHKRTSAGHGDQASAFALAALAVARAGMRVTGVCVGSGGDPVAPREESVPLNGRRRIHKHESRFLGPRVNRERQVRR